MSAAQEIEKLYGDYLEQFSEQNRARRLGQGAFGMGTGPADLPCHVQLLESLKALISDIAGRGAPSKELRAALEMIFREPAELRVSAAAVYWTLLAAQGLSLELIEGLDAPDAAALYESYKSAYPRYKRLPVQRQVLDALGRRKRKK